MLMIMATLMILSIPILIMQITNDIIELEKDRLQINTDVFEGTVNVGIAQVTGDNLGINGICGFVESFISNHFCRNCKIHIVETPSCIDSKSPIDSQLCKLH